MNKQHGTGANRRTRLSAAETQSNIQQSIRRGRDKIRRENRERHQAAIKWLQQQIWNEGMMGGEEAITLLWMVAWPGSVHPAVRTLAGETAGNIFGLDPLPVPTAVDWSEGA